jgi:hypothetical protein
MFYRPDPDNKYNYNYDGGCDLSGCDFSNYYHFCNQALLNCKINNSIWRNKEKIYTYGNRTFYGTTGIGDSFDGVIDCQSVEPAYMFAGCDMRDGSAGSIYNNSGQPNYRKYSYMFAFCTQLTKSPIFENVYNADFLNVTFGYASSIGGCPNLTEVTLRNPDGYHLSESALNNMIVNSQTEQTGVIKIIYDDNNPYDTGDYSGALTLDCGWTVQIIDNRTQN